MSSFKAVFYFALLLALSFTAAAQKSSERKNSGSATSADAQPAREALDLNMYQRIRDEGFDHSHIMEYASALMDGIGPRLTGSPNLKRANDWTRDQFRAMGCTNAHLEDWGEFGLGWRQLNTWMRMTAPDTAVFIAQALPWSPASRGPLSGQVVIIEAKELKDLEKYRGKLAGKIVFFGAMRDVKPVEKPLVKRDEADDLKKLEDFPIRVGEKREDFVANFVKELSFKEKAGEFFAQEHALAIALPSRDGRDGGGSGGTIFDDGGAGMGWFTYQRDHAERLPIVVTAIENYGRVYRLLKANVPVSVEMNVETEFTGQHEHGYDTIAEIPGTDPALKDQVVMVGGHLDSWASGTGATDNGAGTVVAMEVMRILNALHVQPRRTIRVALWTGEEEGEFGSFGYVKQHFGYVPLSSAPDQLEIPEFLRKPGGPVEVKPEQAKISGYFNVDNGSGKIRGVYLQENAAVASIFKQWMEPLADLGVGTLTMRNTGGTDHEAFDAIGIPGFQFIQDPLDYGSRTHHSNMDVYERLQPADLAQAAVVEAIFVYNTAQRDAMLPRKALPHPELEDSSKAPLKNVMPGVVAAAEEQKKEPAPDTKKDETPKQH